MNKSTRNLVKNFSFSAVSNIISMIVSALVVLIVPKSMLTIGYGYYQLYVLYIGYAGFFQFGLIDGIYLRYGGAYYEKLDNNKMFSQYCTLWISQFVLFIIIVILTLSFSAGDRLFVFIAFGIEMILANTRGMLTYVLQATNRIKAGAISNTIGRVAFFIAVVGIMLAKDVTFQKVIIADIFGRCVALAYSSYECKEIVFRKIYDFKIDFKETTANVKTGFFLMLSSICSLLIMGIVRFAMENKWGIETFGKVSLTVSVSNLMVTFINAASLVLFPVLRRVKSDVLDTFYRTVKTSVIPILYCALALYYPVSKLLIAWLPEYETGLRYMAMLFPLCIYEGRMSLLNYTYLKTTSDVKAIFKINAASVIVSGLLTVISVYLFQSIPLAMFSLLAAVMFRCLYADLFIANKINLKFVIPTIEELILMVSFISFSWFIDSFLCILLYVAVLFLYFAINRKQIINGIYELKAIMR